MKKIIVILILLPSILACKNNKSSLFNVASETPGEKLEIKKPSKPILEMVWIRGASFQMGAHIKGYYGREYPEHQIELDEFWMDIHEATKAQYAKFSKATKGAANLNKPTNWWYFTGAGWQHPQGTDCSILNKMNYPVLHMDYEDALTLNTWTVKHLVTEDKWKFASKDEMFAKKFTWVHQGAKSRDDLANIYHGEFPFNNTALNNHFATAPVMQYSPNGYGLYDKSGNVWEWISDLNNKTITRGLLV